MTWFVKGSMCLGATHSLPTDGVWTWPIESWWDFGLFTQPWIRVNQDRSGDLLDSPYQRSLSSSPAIEAQTMSP